MLTKVKPKGKVLFQLCFSRYENSLAPAVGSFAKLVACYENFKARDSVNQKFWDKLLPMIRPLRDLLISSSGLSRILKI